MQKQNKTKLSKLFWRTERRKVSDLVPYSQNPRTLSSQQEKALRESIEKFNLAEIPCINLDGTLAAGHQRIAVLKLLHRENEVIDVRVPSRQLTKSEFKEYLIRSNANHASWNYEILASDFGVNLLTAAGMDDADLLATFDDVLSVDDDDIDLERAIAAAKKTKIKPGDLFSVGPHRIACGNSENLDVVKWLVGNAKIDLVNVDFPYNIGVDYNTGLGGKQAYGGHVDDKKSDTAYRQFLKNIMTNAVAVSKDNAHYLFWANETYLGMMQELMKECDIDFRRLCAWLKGNFNPTPAVAFNKAAEWCSYGTRGKNPYLADRAKNLTEIMNREVDSGSRMLSDVNDLFAIWLAKRVPTQELEHATMKPPSLYEKSLRRCSKPGDAVMDLCSGSGSLGVACNSLKRRAFLCDQEPIFVQVALDRLVKTSNRHVQKIN